MNTKRHINYTSILYKPIEFNAGTLKWFQVSPKGELLIFKKNKTIIRFNKKMKNTR